MPRGSAASKTIRLSFIYFLGFAFQKSAQDRHFAFSILFRKINLRSIYSRDFWAIYLRAKVLIFRLFSRFHLEEPTHLVGFFF